MKLPSQNPANYRTRRGLVDAYRRALLAPSTANRAWWLHNAEHEAAERGDGLPELLAEIREASTPRTLEELTPVGQSRPKGRQ